MSRLAETIAQRAENEMWLYADPIEAVHDVAKRMGMNSYHPAVEAALLRFGLFYRRDWDLYVDAENAAAIDLAKISGPRDLKDQLADVKRLAIAHLRLARRSA